MYLAETLSKENLILQFMQYSGEINPETIHVTELSILHEFRENH